jgi:hypothetical protein
MMDDNKQVLKINTWMIRLTFLLSKNANTPQQDIPTAALVLVITKIDKCD